MAPTGTIWVTTFYSLCATAADQLTQKNLQLVAAPDPVAVLKQPKKIMKFLFAAGQ